MKRLWRDYNLSVVFSMLFVVSLILQTVAGWYDYASQQQVHGQTAAILGNELKANPSRNTS